MTKRATALIGCAELPWCRVHRRVLPASHICPECGPRTVGDSLWQWESPGDRACSHCGYHVCGCGDVRLARTHVHDPGGSYASLLAELPEGYRLGMCTYSCCYALTTVPGTGNSWLFGVDDALLAVEGGTVWELIQHSIRNLNALNTPSPSSEPVDARITVGGVEMVADPSLKHDEWYRDNLARSQPAEPRGTDRPGWERVYGAAFQQWALTGTGISVVNNRFVRAYTVCGASFNEDYLSEHPTLLAAQQAAEQLAVEKALAPVEPRGSDRPGWVERERGGREWVLSGAFVVAEWSEKYELYSADPVLALGRLIADHPTLLAAQIAAEQLAAEKALEK